MSIFEMLLFESFCSVVSFWRFLLVSFWNDVTLANSFLIYIPCLLVLVGHRFRIKKMVFGASLLSAMINFDGT